MADGKITIEIDGIGRVELDEAFKDLSPERQNEVINGIVQSVGGKAAPAEDVRAPWRAAAQGLTFGLSDEIAAAAANPMAALSAAAGGEGKAYYDRLQKERDILAKYREAHPIASAGAEMGGAVIPGLLAAPFTGGASTTGLIPAALRLAGYGAAGGTAYGFGSGEGGLADRAKSALGGGAVGAVAAPVAGALTYPIAVGAKAFADTARSMFGNRAGKAVEAEIQRLAEGANISVDEAAARVASGEILAENQTLRMTTRALMAQGGKPETLIRERMSIRPKQKREEAMAEIQRYLAPNADPNVKRVQKGMEQAARTAEREAYKTIPGAADPAAASVVSTVEAAVKQFPGAARELSEFVGGSTRSKPFFSFKGDEITVGRIPTLQEAEIVRRWLSKKATEAYRNGSPMGEVYDQFEKELRGALDTSSQRLKDVRTGASKLRTAKDAFDYGINAFSKDPDEFEIFMEGIAGDEAALKSLRAGVMAALRRKASGAGGTSLMGRLADEEKAYGQIFRAVFPDQSFDEVMSKVQTAAQSQAARGDIIKGPSTALTQAAGKRLGSDINAEEIVSALRGNPMSAMTVTSKLIGQVNQGLTENQRLAVAQILLSEDPQVVRNVLQDTSGAAMLGKLVERAVAQMRSGALGAATEAGSGYGAETARDVFGPR